MEFSISNTCNLACVMCNGEWSSVIRSRREKLPPLPKVYGDRFFEDLRKYLPHLRQLKVLGGEPFLQQESFRIWDMLIEQNLQTPCHVTTNGTIYNERVERVLDHLPVYFSISMDGATKETVERVRVNANYEQLLENFKKFHAYARRRDTGVNLTYCLMTVNWQDFGDYLLFADDWDCDVFVNTVIHPPQFSLYELPAEQLEPIVRAMQEQSKSLEPRLRRNKAVWFNEVDRLRHRYENSRDPVMSFVPGSLAQQPSAGLLPVLAPNQLELEKNAAAKLRHWSEETIYGLICDPSDVVVDLVGGAEEFFGLSRSDCLGRPIDQIYAQLRGHFGQMTGVVRKVGEPYSERWFGFTSMNLQPTSLRMITFPRAVDSGPAGTITLASVKRQALIPARGGD
jgi:molybdenum cofactor biosynthesis enzyme MoaA